MDYNQTKNVGRQINIMLCVVSLVVLTISTAVCYLEIGNEIKAGTKKEITRVVEIAYNIVDGYKKEADSGLISQADAKVRALAAIKRYNDQNPQNYVWINNKDVTMLVNPTRPVGSDGSVVKDPDGKTFYKDLSDNAFKNGMAYESYKWVKAGQAKDKFYPKMSTARSYNSWGWVVATGAYEDDFWAKAASVITVTVGINFVALIIILILAKFLFINKLTHYLNSVSGNLRDGFQSVTQTAEEFDDLSRRLAEGGAEQAASVQEIAATLEETVSMIHKNDENSRYAAELAKQTQANTAMSYQKMKQLMTAMSKINESSHEISKIIKVIDEIAFQTNILALNAAVEAARAGDAGRGFAVVAEEVRSLAQKSTESASDTAALIESNIELCQNSDEFVKDVHEAIAGIDSDVSKVNELIQEVAVATHEQQIGIEQIHKAVSQVEQVLQSNSQNADKTASSSHSLLSQTGMLNDLVDELSVLVD